MILAIVDDVASRLGRPITDEWEQRRVQSYLDSISALVLKYCTKGIPTPVPADIKGVVCDEVAAALGTSPGVISEQDGDVRVAYSFSAGAGSISRQAKDALASYRKQLVSVPLIGDRDAVQPHC